jgi:competence protein ComEA
MTRTSMLASVAFGMLLPMAAWAGTSTTTSSTAHKSSTHHSSTKSHKVDLNTASKEDLMKLPGVDDATADKIIAGRPYSSKSELVKKNVLTQDEMKKIDAHVMTKAAPKEATKK